MPGNTVKGEAVSATTSTMTQWVHEHADELLRYASVRVSDREVAEDLVQLTFLAAWESRERFQGNSSPRTWLFSILKNKLADHYRKAYRDPVLHGAALPEEDLFDADGQWRPEHIPKDLGTEGASEAEALQHYLSLCLDHLPANWRAAVELKFLQDKDAKVICQELGITPTNYWQQLHRAKLKLRDCISQHLAKDQ